MPNELRDVMELAMDDGVKAWKLLEEHQAAKSQHRKNWISNQLDKCQLRSGQDPTELLSYIVRLYRELELAGDYITDQQVQSKVLSKLSEDYDHFVDMYEDKPSNKKSVMYLKSKLRNEFMKKVFRHPEKYKLAKGKKPQPPFKLQVDVICG